MQKLIILLSLLVTLISSESGSWSIVGTSNVVCIHTALLPNMRVLCTERPHMTPYPQNPLTNGRTSTEIDLSTKTITVKPVLNNPFCCGHSQMSDGNIFYAGGDNQSMADAGVDFIVNGRRGRRIFKTCPSGDTSCTSSEWTLLEDMTTERWYPTVLTLSEGNQLIIGGTTSNLDFDKVAAGDNNNNPTYEYWPKKTDGTWPKKLDLLDRTYPHNLYPPAFQLPNGKVIIFSSNETVILDPKTDAIDTSIPKIIIDDKQPWIYPHTPTAVMLPLLRKNNYQPVIQLCGGSRFKTTVADDRCISIDMSSSSPKWELVDPLPVARLMPDAVLLPDATVLYTNGAGWGQAGGNAGQGQYAGSAVFSNHIFTPNNPAGQRYSTVASSTVSRMYHSGAILLPDGRVLTMGSEEQNYVDFENKKAGCMEPSIAAGCTSPFEYRLEAFEPPYLFLTNTKPVINEAPKILTYKSTFKVSTNTNAKEINFVSFIRYSTTTHSTNTDQRLVELKILGATDTDIYLEAPSDGNLAPPGNWMLFLVSKGNPSIASTILLNAGDVSTVEVPKDAVVPAGTIKVFANGILVVFMAFLVSFLLNC